MLEASVPVTPTISSVKRPFTASNPDALLIAHLNQPAPDPRTIRADVPEHASLAAMKALEKNPADRFQTAGEFAAALA